MKLMFEKAGLRRLFSYDPNYENTETLRIIFVCVACCYKCAVAKYWQCV